MKDFKNIKLSKDERRVIKAVATMLKTRFSAKEVILLAQKRAGTQISIPISTCS